MTNLIASGVVHKVPSDLRKTLTSNPKVLGIWNSLTPLSRNEWICWTVSVKQEKTRKDHVRRVKEELLDGMRRPCCWIGCIHRKDKKISASVKWALNRRSENRT